RLARIALALHVPRAEGGEAPALRRDPAERRRVSAIHRRLRAAGYEAASRQSGLAHPFRQAAEDRDAGLVSDAAHARLVVECRERGDTLGLHWPLPAGRHAQDTPQAERARRIRDPL